jgi:hypothetical protein
MPLPLESTRMGKYARNPELLKCVEFCRKDGWPYMI